MSANLPEKPETTTGTVQPRSDYDRFVEYMRDRAAIEGPLAIQELNEEQTIRILAAQTEEELEAAMDMMGLTGLRELDSGSVIQINGFHLMPGSRPEFANRLGVFAVMDVTILSDTKVGKVGASVVLDTGVDRIITWLRAVEAGQIKGLSFPIQRIVIKVASANGDLITLKRLPPPVPQGKAEPAEDKAGKDTAATK